MIYRSWVAVLDRYSNPGTIGSKEKTDHRRALTSLVGAHRCMPRPTIATVTREESRQQCIVVSGLLHDSHTATMKQNINPCTKVHGPSAHAFWDMAQKPSELSLANTSDHSDVTHGLSALF